MLASAPLRHVILLVDDSPETLRLLVDAFEAEGITALVARDGETALDLLERIEPDLILLDAVMPELDGFETCRLIKMRPAQELTPVVFMTGLSDTDHVVKALQAGGVDYVTKPIQPDELLARIRTHIANATLIRQARRALDIGAKGVAALAPDGRVVWASPRAQDLLEGGIAREALAELIAWFARAAQMPVSKATRLTVPVGAGGGVVLGSMGREAQGLLLVQVCDANGDTPAFVLQQELSLTPRESEVLAWLAEGKSNRDIAEILGLSARTVTKHMEQILQKLGVENRTAAAAVALRALA